jgi:branched-subunit amino acid ABC-type transport system permease component/ABC-type branched-subunit amino acid transport system substrate-binding protein
MNWKARLPLVAFVVFAAVGVASLLTYKTRALQGDDNVIKIVSSMPRSGSARGQTDTIRNGLLLAFHEVGNSVELIDPKTGQKKTYQLQYEDLDDATASAGDWTIEQEIANANYAVRDPDVMAYVGTYNSGAAKVSMPILNRAGVLMISPANTAESLTKPGTGDRHEPACYRPTGNLNYVRVVPTDDLQSLLSVVFMARPTIKNADGSVQQVGLNAKKIYILDDNQLYGKGLAESVEKICKSQTYNIQVLGHESIDAKAQTYETLMTKIKSLKPDVIYFGGTTQSNAGQLIKDMKKAGLTIPLVGPDGTCENAIITAAGADTFDAVPFYATFPGLIPDVLQQLGGRGKQFVDGYAELYPVEEMIDGKLTKVKKPPTEAYAVYGYECGIVLIDAIRKAGVKDRKAICEAVLSVKEYAGASGPFAFDKNGDTTNSFMTVNRVLKVAEKNPDTGVETVSSKFTLAARVSPPNTNLLPLTEDSKKPQPVQQPSFLEQAIQFTIVGLTYGCLFALIALGYTMVYGIVELINFAHGDLFMLGGFMAMVNLGAFGLLKEGAVGSASVLFLVTAVACAVIGSSVFCASLNFAVDRFIYLPLRNAPRLAPLVSAIGVSFLFMNAGLFWGGSQPVSFPDLLPNTNWLDSYATVVPDPLGEDTLNADGTTTPATKKMIGSLDLRNVRFTSKNAVVFGITIPLMIILTLFVKFSKLGKAMRAVAQNPAAAKLMGINTDRVIGLTFLIGGALAGVASVIYGLTIGTVKFDMGYQNGLYAFTAAVLGGIGRLPGAVLGGLLIGLISAYGSGFGDERWNGALIFGLLIVILVFRPTGLLGSTAREKV